MSQENKPVLVFVRGMPGSGKSYLAAALEKALGKENVLMLDPDKIDLTAHDYTEFSKFLTAEGLDEKIHPFRWLRTSAYGGIKAHNIIIWNQPFTNEGVFNRLISHLQDYAQEHQIDLPVLVVEVKIDPTVAKDRVNQRKLDGGHGPSENTLNKRIADHKSYVGESFITVTVEGDADVSTSVAKVTKVLNQLRQN